MATDLGTLKYTLTADTGPLAGALASADALVKQHASGLSSTLDNVGASSSKMSKAMMVGSAAVAIGVGIIADKSIKAAESFQTLTTQLVTGAGESQKNLAMVAQGILSISDTTTSTSTDLAQGMFLIESAGYHGAAGLDVLKVAAQGAEVGGASLNDTADAMTTVMHDYGISANNSGQAMNFLVSTMQNGKMHLQDLVGSLGKVLPAASQLHVPLAQVGGALSTLTQAGIPATRAATALNMTMLQLAAPSSKASAALKSVGLSSTELGNTLTQKGLLQALQLVTDAVGKKFKPGSAQYLAALSAITGGVRGLSGTLGTTGQNMSTFISNTQKISDATAGAGNKVIGFATANQTAAAHEKELKNTMDSIMITIGTGLLPVVTNLVSVFESILKPIASWIESHQKLATIILGSIGVVATLVTTILLAKKAFGAVKDAINAISFVKTIAGFGLTVVKAVISAAMTTAAWVGSAVATAAAWVVANAAMIAGIGLVLIVIVGVALLIIKHWSDVKQWFHDFLNDIKKAFDVAWAAIKTVVNTIVSIFKTAFTNAWNAIVKVFDFMDNFVYKYIKMPILNAIKDAANWLLQAGKDIINGLVKGVESLADAPVKAVEKVASGIKNVAKDVLKIFSPSQVFADIGSNVSLGLAQGISQSSNKAMRATTDLTTGVVRAGSSSMASVTNNSSTSGVVYNFAQGSVILSTKDAVDEFFAIGNRSTQLELSGGSPLAGTTGV